MSGVLNPQKSYVGSRLHVTQAGNLYVFDPPMQLEDAAVVFAADNNSNGFTVGWTNPLVVPIGLRLEVRVGGELIETVNRLPGTVSYVANQGVGDYEVTIFNRGNGETFLTSAGAIAAGSVTNHAPVFTTVDLSNYTPVVGDIVAVLFDGNNLGTPTFQWMADGADLPGETGDSITASAEMIGQSLDVRLHAENAYGSQTVTSPATDPVVPADP